jgi:HEAT repeat protein
MGADAKPALPALTKLLFHSNTVWLSAVPLAGMGSDGLPPLIAALTNQNSSIRHSAATVLAWERSDLNLVVPALIARLSDQDLTVHLAAVSALGQMHAEPGLAVPALMKDFPGNDPLLRSSIAVLIVFCSLAKRPCATGNVSEHEERPTTREPGRSY